MKFVTPIKESLKVQREKSAKNRRNVAMVSLKWSSSCLMLLLIISSKLFKVLERCKESTTLFGFSTNLCILYIARRFGWRLQPFFRQFVNLINHNTMQWYSRWNTSNYALSEERRTKNWSMLKSSQDTTLLLYPVMSSCGDPVIQLWRSSKLPKRGVNV